MSYVLKTNYALRSNYGSARSTSKIKYIVIHYTANDGDHDESNAKFFKSAYRGASAHYFVDDDSATISVPDTYVAYSVGGSRYSNYKTTGGASMYKVITNANSLNIEMCDTVKNGKHDVTEKTLQNTAELVVSLMRKYNIPIANVYRHFDVTGKSCPSYWATKNNAGFEAFKKRISNMLTPTTETKYVYNGIDYSLVFDPNYYTTRYSDLKAAFGNNTTNLFNHFIQAGMPEGRQASASFDPIAYRNRYKDLQDAFGYNMPMYYQHFITAGKAEGRIGK